MPPICKDEMDDAQQAAEHYGYGQDEFAFLYRPYAPLRSEPVPIVADVEVTHTHSGISKTYDAGNGSTWPADFARDVEAGQFGVIVGARRVSVGKASQSVQVRGTGLREHMYRVQPEAGDVFGVEARTDAELLDAVARELRRRNPSTL